MGLLVALAFASGCITGDDPGPVQTFAITMQPAGEASLSARVDMGAGTLSISGAPDSIFDIDVQYTEDKWLPLYAYTVTGTRGHLELIQGSNVSIQSGEVNAWNVTFGQEAPLALDARLGAGDLVIDLSDVPITSLYAETDAGDMYIDLRGSYLVDVTAEIHAGVGDIELYLPSDVGAIVHVVDDTDVAAYNLMANGTTFSNSAYGQSPVTVEVTISSGVGDVSLYG
jgi:hypothetical protein